MEDTKGSDRVVWRVSNGVADVRLNRPDKLNALDPDMFSALGQAGDALGADRTVRAVVISGEGRGFCAGLDVMTFAAMATDGAGGLPEALGRRPGDRDTNHAQHAVRVWAELAVPVIAAVHGVALGGGLQLALGADLRIVAPDARLSVLEVRWGMVPDMTGTWVLPRLVGMDVAKELTWTGRMVSGIEAVSLGLATRSADDPRADALALAQAIAASSPDAVQAAKVLLDASLEAGPAEQFRAEAKLNGGLIGSPNQTEAATAFLGKRTPAFVDRPR
ncbi:MAG: crotonase/enoyl-CoA hydratase family protein [Actinomycetota bacterium]|nr:crotonase/enoyl-CoA hydratase family protein [Actinomycetota bacterium]